MIFILKPIAPGKQQKNDKLETKRLKNKLDAVRNAITKLSI